MTFRRKRILIVSNFRGRWLSDQLHFVETLNHREEDIFLGYSCSELATNFNTLCVFVSLEGSFFNLLWHLCYLAFRLKYLRYDWGNNLDRAWFRFSSWGVDRWTGVVCWWLSLSINSHPVVIICSIKAEQPKEYFRIVGGGVVFWCLLHPPSLSQHSKTLKNYITINIYKKVYVNEAT